MSHQAETEDYLTFGPNAWIYCKQHLRPHTTGWCTVSTKHKVLLQATTDTEAYRECFDKDFYIFDSTPYNSPHLPFYPKTERK